MSVESGTADAKNAHFTDAEHGRTDLEKAKRDPSGCEQASG
jgi:hypothetical protein